MTLMPVTLIVLALVLRTGDVQDLRMGFPTEARGRDQRQPARQVGRETGCSCRDMEGDEGDASSAGLGWQEQEGRGLQSEGRYGTGTRSRAGYGY
jgi:hypothetical protein